MSRVKSVPTSLEHDRGKIILIPFVIGRTAVRGRPYYLCPSDEAIDILDDAELCGSLDEPGDISFWLNDVSLNQCIALTDPVARRAQILADIEALKEELTTLEAV